ncbi:cytosolic acyl coenzyme A thioester hydrolase-like [Leptonychotes weddellii]|uniref:Cytosolic acyl coenzyme A thioester hydrolase-like n=1 Tax=Leptonychotes weddellii TaxID=9713 RepID=A0A7F8PXM4_LEPWE|nr:cytosolic acyl coenzyme A thioester hydrolase-like [Leptonychotes weddellii]
MEKPGDKVELSPTALDPQHGWAHRSDVPCEGRTGSEERCCGRPPSRDEGAGSVTPPGSASRGTKKLTNKATLWYVPLSLKNVDKVLEVPPVVYSRQEQEEEGRKRYEAQKLERMETKWRNGDIVQPVLNPGWEVASPCLTCHVPLLCAGVTMKLMDEVAGIVAARHCKTNIVTASVDAINFHDKIRKGYVITISGRMTFTSNKSMEIEVLVDADPVVDNSQKRYRAASAFFTYVSLSQEGKSLPVPQLVPETEDEKKRFEEGKGRYLQMKAKRQGRPEPQP